MDLHRGRSSRICATRCWARFKWGTCLFAVLRDPDKSPKPGLLGADYVVENNRYKFSKIYNGQNWTPSLTAPLTLPGINITAGDYLLAVNGRELHATDNLNSFFEGTAGKQTVLRVGHKADGSDARDVTVVPADSEHGLRNLDWIESNRRKVDELSGGKVAYIYMPNTGGGLRQLQPLLLFAAG